MLLYQDVSIYPGIFNTNMFMNKYMPGQEMGVFKFIMSRCSFKEIRIKKHDQNANLCLIIATD